MRGSGAVVMSRLKKIIRHHCNPLHVYCRLRDCGMGHERALRISELYEHSRLHRMLCV